MRLKKTQWIGIIFGAIVILSDLVFFLGDRIFWFLIGIGLVVLGLPFLISYMLASEKEKEKNDKFLEFTRNLAESVKAGTPIGKSIVNLAGKDFGSLTPHIRKLANQITLGIPISRAFETFALEVESETIKRAIVLIREAEDAGGEIDYILDSVARSIYEIEKLKKERKNSISNLVVQGYIIFLIFVGIMLVMEFKILPLTSGIGSFSGGFTGGFENAAIGESSISPEHLTRPFMVLLLVQGIFAGLTIGKLSEGNVKAGIKHSFVLTILAFLIATGARAFLG